MSAERKIWHMPTLGEVSVRDALTGSSDLPSVIAAGPTMGPNGTAATSFGPQPEPFYGPVQGSAFSGPPAAPPALFGPPAQSDVRLKEDIRQTGTTVYGLPLYVFSYRGQAGTYEGVMAQDVLAVRPDAVVVGADGFYRVDYAKLGIPFRRLH